MVDKTLITNKLVEHAIGYLIYDEQHPDVGMGMFPETAVNLAIEDVKKEALDWTKESVEISNDQVSEAVRIVRSKARRKFPYYS